MVIDEFVSNFAKQFEEADPKSFNLKTRFRDIEEWSSFYALTIIAMVDEEYNIKIKGEDIRNSQTIEDLFNIVKTRI